MRKDLITVDFNSPKNNRPIVFNPDSEARKELNAERTVKALLNFVKEYHLEDGMVFALFYNKYGFKCIKALGDIVREGDGIYFEDETQKIRVGNPAARIPGENALFYFAGSSDEDIMFYCFEPDGEEFDELYCEMEMFLEITEINNYRNLCRAINRGWEARGNIR